MLGDIFGLILLAMTLIGIFTAIQWHVKWTPLSRPFFARNKLMPGGVLGLSLGAAMEARPLPFRPLNRRSGRIPAEPYPPFKCLHCRTDILARKR